MKPFCSIVSLSRLTQRSCPTWSSHFPPWHDKRTTWKSPVLLERFQTWVYGATVTFVDEEPDFQSTRNCFQIEMKEEGGGEGGV